MVSYVRDTVIVATQAAIFQQDVELQQLVCYYIIKIILWKYIYMHVGKTILVYIGIYEKM